MSNVMIFSLYLFVLFSICINLPTRRRRIVLAEGQLISIVELHFCEMASASVTRGHSRLGDSLRKEGFLCFRFPQFWGENGGSWRTSPKLGKKYLSAFLCFSDAFAFVALEDARSFRLEEFHPVEYPSFAPRRPSFRTLTPLLQPLFTSACYKKAKRSSRFASLRFAFLGIGLCHLFAIQSHLYIATASETEPAEAVFRHV